MRALAWSLLLFMYSDQRPTTTTIIIFIIVVMREKCLYLFIVVSSTHRRTPGPVRTIELYHAQSVARSNIYYRHTSKRNQKENHYKMA